MLKLLSRFAFVAHAFAALFAVFASSNPLGGGGLAALTAPDETVDKITDFKSFALFANKETWKARLSNILKDNEILLAGAKHAKWLEDEEFENSIWVYLRDVLAENAVAEKHDMSQIIYFKKNFDCARFSNANWNAFLIRNTINRALDTGYNNGFYEKTKNAVINEKVVDDTVNFLLGNSEYQKFASKIRDASDDVKKYANALRLYRHLENLRVFRNQDGFLDNLKNSPSQLSTCTVAPGIRGRFKKDGEHFEGQIIFKDLDVDERLWNKKDKDLPKLEFYCRYIRDVPSQYYVKRHSNTLYKLDHKMQVVQLGKISGKNAVKYDLTAFDKKMAPCKKLIEETNTLDTTIDRCQNVIENMRNDWGVFPDISDFEGCMKFMSSEEYKDMSNQKYCLYAAVDDNSWKDFIKKVSEYISKIKDREEKDNIYKFWVNLKNLSFDTLPRYIDSDTSYFISDGLEKELLEHYDKLKNNLSEMEEKCSDCYLSVFKTLEMLNNEMDVFDKLVLNGYYSDDRLDRTYGIEDISQKLIKLQNMRDQLMNSLDKKNKENKLWNTEKEYFAYYFIDKDLGKLYSAKKKK